MDIIKLNMSSRKETGKGPARRSRMTGAIPGTLYGGGSDPIAVTLNAKAFETIVRGKAGAHAVLELKFDDEPSLDTYAMVKNVQRHPTRENATHADFFRININQRIETEVAIRVVGRSKGVAEGGITDQHIHSIPLECLASRVPEFIEVDITELTIGSALHVGNLTAPDGVKFLVDDDATVIAIAAPRVAVLSEEEEAAAEAAEPEVIGGEGAGDAGGDA